MYVASTKVPGSCGELIQGTIAKSNFLVTCPIDLYSLITVKLSEDYAGFNTNINAEKTVIAVKKVLLELNRAELGARIEINSQLLRGKGMASSTADIAAATGATMAALGYNQDLNLIKKIALEIEPTDGVFLPGICFFDHLEGKVLEYLGEPPELDILIFSERGQVDTINFNRRYDLPRLNSDKEGVIQEAIGLIRAGIKTKNLKFIGQGATLSSLAHQSILYKPNLEKIIYLTEKIDGVYGVNIAHSGTLIGLIIEKDLPEGDLLTNIKANTSGLTFIKRVQMISGGLEIKSGEEAKV
jgi:L-threonine kinase